MIPMRYAFYNLKERFDYLGPSALRSLVRVPIKGARSNPDPRFCSNILPALLPAWSLHHVIYTFTAIIQPSV